MSKYSNEKRRSEKKDNFMPATGKSGNKSYGYSSGSPKAEKSQGFNRGPRPAQSRKAVKSYNPLVFIKKVEEEVAAVAYTSKHTFADFLIDDQIKANISARGYVTPTPIQDQAIPLLLQGKDVIGTANTGTGKTAAFLIPLVHNVLTKKINRVLIVTPTRELAAQIQSELDFFKAKTGLGSVLCIGGLSPKIQMQQLKKEPAFIIGTPGRLLDLEQQAALHFRKYDAIVLDEVDTMLDMGFINDIKYIISKLPEKRHSLFFSATISPAIQQVMNGFLSNPVSISVKTRQSSENVNQDVVKVAENNKIELLHDLLIKPAFTRVIIFSRTKRATDKLAKALKERGFDVASIHGDKTQAQRKKALDMFKADSVKILLATDVVARGIDIDDVSHVINYDLPQTYEDYIHRIGRTGRANKIGQALTFIE